MAEFEIEAKVKPTLDRRQKRKVQSELSEMGGVGGMSGGGASGSKTRLKRINSNLNEIQGTLEQIRNILAGGAGGLGATSAGRAFKGRRQAGDSIGMALKGALAQTDIFGKEVTGGMAEFTDVEHRQLKSLSDISETGVKLVAGFSMMMDTFVEYGDSMLKWLKVTAINTGQIGRQIIMGVGKFLFQIGSAIVTAIGGVGALLKAGAVALTVGAIAGISKFVGGVEQLKQRSRDLKSAFSTLEETPWKSIGTIIGTNFKNMVDPTGIGEALAEKGISYFKTNFPKTSELIGEKFNLVEDKFYTGINNLKNLTLPSIGFSVPSELNGLLKMLGLGGSKQSKATGNPRRRAGIARMGPNDSSGTTSGESAISTEINLDLAPDIDIDPKEITDELEDTVESEINDAIEEIERRFQVDL